MRIVRFVKVSRRCRASLGGGERAYESYGSNQGLVVGDHASLVVDAGFHGATARGLLWRIGRRQRKRILVVDSHYHSDHVFGNHVFASHGATIIAHENCRRRMLRSSSGLLARYRRQDPQLRRLLRNVEVAVPNITYRDRLSAYIDDEVRAEIIHPEGIAHTDGDSMVFVPEDRTLFAGDILWVDYHPNLEDADIQGQVRALRAVLRLKPRRIVPGHGPVSGLREVKGLIRYLEELDKNSGSALKEGLTGDRLVRRVIPSWAWDWKMRWVAESYIRKLGNSLYQH